MNTNLTRMTLALIVSLLASCKAWTQERTGNSQEVHCRQYNEQYPLIVPVKMANQTMRFLIDTGASICAINDSHQELLGPSDGTRNLTNALGQSKGLPSYQRNPIEVENLRRLDCDFVKFDMAPLQALIGVPTDGILGTNYLRDVSFGYDRRDNTVYFGRDSNRHFEKRLKFGNRSPAAPSAGGVRIDGLGRNLIFDLDTGSSSEITIPSFDFDNLVRSGRIHSLHEFDSYVIGGMVTKKTGRLYEANIWGTTFTDIPISEGWDYRIGIPLLRRFNFYFDFEAGELLVQSDMNTNLPFLVSVAGFHTKFDEDRVIVIDVVEGSQAEEGEVKVGDIVLAVDGKKVQPPSMDDVSKQRYGVMKLTLLRDGQTFDRTIELRDFQNTTAR